MNLKTLRKGKVLLVDKPLNWTSFDIVNKLRYAILKHYDVKKFKVGHAGTLDPLATGLLIVCVGKATKTIHEFQNLDKEYTGTFTLGATTPSYDKETAINQQFETSHIDEKLILETANSFLGKQKQVPPIFSAIKKNGKKMYEHARKGESVKMEARDIEITEFEITDISLPEISFRLRVSKGTYIRSIAYDFGSALKSGAYLSSLRRTKIGNFSVDDAVTYQESISGLTQKDAI